MFKRALIAAVFGTGFWILLLSAAKELSLSTAGKVFFSSHLPAFVTTVFEDVPWSSFGITLSMARMGTFSNFFGVSLGDIKLNSLLVGVLGAVWSTRGSLWPEPCATIYMSAKRLSDVGDDPSKQLLLLCKKGVNRIC